MMVFKEMNGDICLCGEKDVRVLRGLDAIMQLCENKARTILGEVTTDITLGMPYQEAVWGAQVDVGIFAAWFKRRMLEVEGVTGVSDFTASVKNNEFVYSATIETIYGNARL